jgi:hypothetical protein
MPELWKSRAREPAFLPQLRQTTELENLNQEADLASWELNFF